MRTVFVCVLVGIVAALNVDRIGAQDPPANHQPPVTEQCPGGQATDVLHAYSECSPLDFVWHVVVDREYVCPNGNIQRRRERDQATTEPCDKPALPTTPRRIRTLTAGDFPQVTYDDKAVPIGIITFMECINGFWTPVEYQAFAGADGRIRIDRNRPVIKQPTDQPCTARQQAAAPGPRFVLEPLAPALAVNAFANLTSLNALPVTSAMLSADQRITASETAEATLDELADPRLLVAVAPAPARFERLWSLLSLPRVLAAEASPVQLVFSSLGGSTGGILEMQVFKSVDADVSLEGLDLVLEPLKEDASKKMRAALARRGRPARTVKMNGYCLEFLKTPPAAGILFRIAGEDVQQQFAPTRRILAGARQVLKAGELRPDSDPKAYFHSVRQWAIWTNEGRLDRNAFEQRFVEHTRKNVTAGGGKWTREAEATIRRVAPGRWNDIRKILNAAGVNHAR